MKKKRPAINWDYIIKGLIAKYTDTMLGTIDYEAIGEEIVEIYSKEASQNY